MKQYGIALLILASSVGAAQANIYSCVFPQSGPVIIDTRKPSRSITINGVKKPATSGSYFYQTTDGFAVAFTPGMKIWEILPDGERATRCRMRKG